MRKLLVLPLAFLLLGSASLSFAQTPATPEIQVNVETEGHQMLPQVAMNALGDFVVVWGSRERQDVVGEISLHARRFAADGTPETDEILVHENVGDSVETAVAMMEDGSFVVIYAGGLEDFVTGEITTTVFEGRRFAADGAPLGEPFAIGPRRNARNLSIAARPEGGFVVAWEARRQAREVFVRIFDGDGSPVRNEISVAEGNGPALDVGPEGEIVVAWMATEPGGPRRRYFVALQRFSPNGDQEGRRQRVSNNSPNFLHSIRIAKNETGSFTVLWGGVFNHVYRGILARRYSPNGAPLTRIERLDSSGAEREIAPDRNGDFVLLWSGGTESDDGLEVLGRKYRSHLHPTRRVFRVNTTRRGHQREVAVADDMAGNFVVVWQSEEEDSSDSDVFARVFRR